MMGGTGVIDRFLEVFTRYIDSGFGLLNGEVAFLATTLAAIDITLAAIFWSWAADEDIIARLAKKTLFVGVFAYLIGNWNNLARIVFESFAGLGLKASGTGMSTADLLSPGHVAQVGIDAGRPILDSISGLMGYISFFENFVQIVVLLFAWCQIALGSKRAELDKKRQQLDTLKPRAAALMRTQSQTQLANQWFKNRNCWIDVLSALRQNVNTRTLWIVNASFEDPGILRLQGKALDDNHVTEFVTALKKTGKFGNIAIERLDTPKSDNPSYRKDFTVNAHLLGVDLKKKT